MRITTHFPIVSLLLLGIHLSYPQSKSTNSPPVKATPEPPKESGGYWEKLVLHPFVDGKGTVIVEMPFPASWKVMTNAKRGEPTLTGPNHIKVIDFPAQMFLNTSDPQMQQIYRRNGQQLRPMPGVEQLVQQDLAPWAAGQGLEFVRQYEVPEVSRIDKWYNDQLYKVSSSPMKILAFATEWKHTVTGNLFFLLTHLTVNDGGNMQTWSYFSNGLQAEKAQFATARKQLIFGLANARYNPEPIMAYNKAEAERVGKSWEDHNRRMAQNRANFEASQRAFVNRSKAINDSIMKGWTERNAASDKAHEQFVDTITERTKVVDTSTGQQYKVESGANQYWMNRDGEYFGTDNRSYDPNRDDNMNRQNWQKLKTVE